MRGKANFMFESEMEWLKNMYSAVVKQNKKVYGVQFTGFPKYLPKPVDKNKHIMVVKLS